MPFNIHCHRRATDSGISGKTGLSAEQVIKPHVKRCAYWAETTNGQ
ncbi:MAG: hypothetical protein U5L03_12250 [Burkholderiaceae bacterium]|nr:hypothetical protein [Burkholderiaceae bacterium]